MPESNPSKLYFCADKSLKKCAASCTFVVTKQPAAIMLRRWLRSVATPLQFFSSPGILAGLWARTNPCSRNADTRNETGLPGRWLSGEGEKSLLKFWFFQNNA